MLLDYPADYPIKAIVHAGEEPVEHVRSLLLRAVPGLALGAASVRSSAGGKYVAVTLEARLESEEQRRAVHAALAADPRVAFQV